MQRIAPSPLTAAAGVNGQFRCDCGGLQFLIGVAAREETGNNFIRVAECTGCGMQHLIVHKSDARLEPAIAGKLKAMLS